MNVSLLKNIFIQYPPYIIDLMSYEGIRNLTITSLLIVCFLWLGRVLEMDKKLKMVQLQLQKAKFDAAENKANGNDTAIQGEAEEFEDRNALINAVINKMNNSDK